VTQRRLTAGPGGPPACRPSRATPGGVVNAVLEDENLIEEGCFIDKVDELPVALASVRVTANVDLAAESERKMAEKSAAWMCGRIGAKPWISADCRDDGFASSAVSSPRAFAGRTGRAGRDR
jgi:hypothetical protein